MQQLFNMWPSKAFDMSLVTQALVDVKDKNNVAYFSFTVDIEARGDASFTVVFEPWLHALVASFSEAHRKDGVQALIAFTQLLTELRFHHDRILGAESWNLFEFIATAWMTHELTGKAEPFQLHLTLADVRQHAPDCYQAIVREIEEKKRQLQFARPTTNHQVAKQ